MTKRKAVKMDSSGIILGAQSVISGMFRKNEEDPEIDDSYFMPMLKTCIHTTVEEVRRAGLPESEITAIHDALYQHCLDLYIKGWLAHAHEDETDIDDEAEVEDATGSFLSFYEGNED